MSDMEQNPMEPVEHDDLGAFCFKKFMVGLWGFFVRLSWFFV
jgi:hypothetical protein